MKMYFKGHKLITVILVFAIIFGMTGMQLDSFADSPIQDYTVTYDETFDDTFNTDDAYELTPPDNKEFKDLDAEQDGSGTDYAPKDAVTTPADVLTSYETMGDTSAEIVLLSRGKSYTKSIEPNASYPDTGNAESTNGIISTHHDDGGSYGYRRGTSSFNVDITIDLENVYNISKVKVLRYTYGYYPNKVKVYTSINNKTFTFQAESDTATNSWFELDFAPVNARYVRVNIEKNSGDDWVFIDEIEVYGINEIVEPKYELVSVTPVRNVKVGYGTSEADALAALPPTTTIKDEDNRIHTVKLNWTIDGYNGNVTGNYTATGTFVLPEGVIQPAQPIDLSVTSIVTVREASDVVGEGVNVALASNGGIARASSVYSSNYPVEAVNDGDRAGIEWENGGVWADATPDEFPDWVEISFDSIYSIDTINVFTLQDDVDNMCEPTLYMDFTKSGITMFDVQYWDINSQSWKLVPGGKVTDNINVWRQFRFAPVNTNRIRVLVKGALQQFSRIAEIEAFTAAGQAPEPAPGTNVAHLSNRAVATASSEYSVDYPAMSVIDGDRTGYYWGYGGGWMDATSNEYPDWVQIEFDSDYEIEIINVYTVQDNTSVEPTLDMRFSTYGIKDFDVQYWDKSKSEWITVPGGSVRGNNKVWNRFKFEPVTTNKIRVVVNNAAVNFSRIVEIEALTPIPENMMSDTTRKFIHHGFMFQTSVATDESGRQFPTAEEWINSGFTSATYYEPPYYNKTLSNSVEGLKWSLCYLPFGTPAVTRSDGFLKGDQLNDIDNLVTFSIGDEIYYSNRYEQESRDMAKMIRELYPNVVIHSNQIGNWYSTGVPQWTEHQLRSYIRNTKPDFIAFDDYYFCETGSDININDRIVSQTAMYRALSLEGWDGSGTQPIAFGQYIIGFKTGSTVYATGWYEPTQSQLYAVPYITMALGGKWLSMFRWEFYNEYYHDGTKFLLFDKDGNPTKFYHWYGQLGKEVKNLGSHLVRLYSSDARFLPGKHMESGIVVENKMPDYISGFEAKADYNLTNIAVTNMGTENNGLPGDIIIGYFDILPGVDRSFFTSSSPKYFMVVNGLHTGNGLRPEQQNGMCEDTQQEITLTFDFSTGGDPTKLRKVNRETGAIENVELTHVSGSIYELELVLGGGEGELFYFEYEGEYPEPVQMPEPVPAALPNPLKQRTVAENLALGKSYTKSKEPATQYPDKDNSESTDGIIAGDYQDGKSYGYNIGSGSISVDVVIDLETVQTINNVRVSKWQGQYNYGADEIEVYTSSDNVNFTFQGKGTLAPSLWYEVSFNDTDARYVKVTFKKTGNDWLFIDEIQVFKKDNAGDTSEETIIMPEPEPEPVPGTNLAYGKTYRKSHEPNSAYPDTNKSESTDGILAGDYLDGKSYGYNLGTNNVDITVDLGKERYIDNVKVHKWEGAYLYEIDKVTVYTSTDNINFTLAGAATVPSGPAAKWYDISFSPTNARYVKVKFEKRGNWMFVDEILIYDTSGLPTGITIAPVPNPPEDTENVAFGKTYVTNEKTGGNHSDSGYELTNGIYGAGTPNDSQWQGIQNTYYTRIFDLESKHNIRYISASFLKYAESGIHLPKEVIYSYSTDGVNFVSLGRATLYPGAGSLSSPDKSSYKYIMLLDSPEVARYVKIDVITGLEGAWTFEDEVEIWGTEYVPPKYTVTYDANGGKGDVPTETDKIEGETFTVADAGGLTPPEGRKFKEWNTAADGSGTGYTAGDTVTMPAGNLTLYAIWEVVLSSNNNLSGLKVSEGTLTPEFDAGVVSYNVSVGNKVTSIEVTATAADSKATIKINGNVAASGVAEAISLSVGNNGIEIVVTAEDGSEKTYTITVNRAEPTKYTVTYDANGGKGDVPTETDKIEGETFTVADAGGLTPPEGRKFKEWNTAADGSGTGYTAGDTVTMPAGNLTLYAIWEVVLSSNNNLSGLKVSEGTLTPEFDAGVVSYNVSVGNKVTSIEVTATAADSKATIKINGNVAASGVAEAISLSVGNNGIEIVVTAEDGSEKTYTITVNRAQPSTGGNVSPIPVPVADSDPDTDADTTYYAVIDGDTSLEKIPVKVDEEIGKGMVSLDSPTIETLFANKDNAIITMPSITGINAYTLEVPASDLTGSIKTSELSFGTDVGSIVIPDNMLREEEGTEEKHVSITIEKYDVSNLPDNIKEAIGDRPVVQLTLKIDGERVEWSNPNAFVTVSIPYTPTAAELENPEHIVVWYIDGAGNVISIPSGRYDAETGMVTFTTTHFSKYAVAFVKKTFDDITNYAWAKKEIEVMASKGIINGTSATAFNPSADITRADFIVMLVRALGLDAEVNENFSDVSPDEYYAKQVGIAKKLGITNGVGNNEFRPNDKIVRQDMIALIDRALKIVGKGLTEGTDADLEGFADKESIASYARNSVATLTKSGIIKGDGTNINPLGNTTRAEAAVVIYRIYNK